MEDFYPDPKSNGKIRHVLKGSDMIVCIMKDQFCHSMEGALEDRSKFRETHCEVCTRDNGVVEELPAKMEV